MLHKNKTHHSSHIETTIVAHDGQFHADDACAVATLLLMIEKTAAETNVAIIRTRDGEVIQNATYVVDVGGVHDAEKNRFDHHQAGGAGERANGIPYAAFGLVWKKFGAVIAGSPEVAAAVDERLVQVVDANDNGVSVAKELFPNVRPYDVSAVIGAMNLNWDEEGENDAAFMSAVEIAKQILTREIERTKSGFRGAVFALEAYAAATDKRIIVLERNYPFEKIFSEKPEPLFVVYPKEGKWYVKAVRNAFGNFENRKNLPAAWAGKRGVELSAVTGVSGSIFCHNKLFMASANTKEGAIRLAEIAVEA